MNYEYMKIEHRFNKKFLETFNLELGSKITIRKWKYEMDVNREVEITWINPYYYWFGSEEGSISPRDIVSINGVDVREQIKQMITEKEKEQDDATKKYLSKL
jgi:hypothetical protein